MRSDFKPEVEIRPIRACTMKIMHLWASGQNSCILQEIGVEKHDSDIRFQTRSRNMAISSMYNEKYAI